MLTKSQQILPWEERGAGFIKAGLRTLGRIVASPRQAFSGAELSDYKRPLTFLFFSCTSFVLACLGAVLLWYFARAEAYRLSGALRILPAFFLPFAFFAFQAFFSAVGAHVAMLLFGSEKKPFVTAFALFCYLHGAMILALPLFLIPLAGQIYALAVIVYSIGAAYRVSIPRATVIYLVGQMLAFVLETGVWSGAKSAVGF